jgi:hypothetical protein
MIMFMKPQILLAHIGIPPHIGGLWWFLALVLLILFVTLIVADGSRNKDK